MCSTAHCPTLHYTQIGGKVNGRAPEFTVLEKFFHALAAMPHQPVSVVLRLIANGSEIPADELSCFMAATDMRISRLLKLKTS